LAREKAARVVEKQQERRSAREQAAREVERQEQEQVAEQLVREVERKVEEVERLRQRQAKEQEEVVDIASLLMMMIHKNYHSMNLYGMTIMMHILVV